MKPERPYTIVTVAHEADFGAMRLQARSLAAYAPEFITSILVVENFSDPTVRWRDSLLAEYGPLAERVRFHSSAEFGDFDGVEGWWSQQYLKLAVAELVSTERYMVLDAKNHLVSPLALSFLEAGGRPRLRIANYHDHPLRGYLEQVCDYWNIDVAAQLAAFPTTAPPFVMDAGLVRELVRTVEAKERRPFAEFFLDGRRMTEFFLYSGFLTATGRLEAAYELHREPAPTIWQDQTSQAAVVSVLAASNSGANPFLGAHRRAIGKLDRGRLAAWPSSG